MRIAFAVVLAYLLGSIPAAFLAGKLSKGIDLRRHGSGNLGATNAYRVLGSQVAVLVWLVDTAKGFACVYYLPHLFHLPEGPWWPLLMGAAAIAGHTRSVFLGRGGGKGVATAAGIFLALAWLPALLAITAWCIVLWRTGYVSLASLTAAVTLSISLVAVKGIHTPEFLAGLVITIFVFWSHRQNIARLRNGEEHRFTAGNRTPVLEQRPEAGPRRSGS